MPMFFQPRFSTTSSGFVLNNGYVQITFSSVEFAITSLIGDYSGQGQFQSEDNVLRGLGWRFNSSESLYANSAPKISYHKQTHSVEISEATNFGSKVWMISLSPSSRSFEFNSTISIPHEASDVGIFIDTNRVSQYGQALRGAFQMMNRMESILGTESPMHRWYALGGERQGTIDIQGIKSKVNGSVKNLTNLFLSSTTWANSSFYLMANSSFPQDQMNNWVNIEEPRIQDDVKSDVKSEWDLSLRCAVNNYNFPTGGLSIENSLPENDTKAILTGAYANPAGCLHTFFNATKGFSAPSIATPDVAYSGGYNFFDPDNFIAISALLDVGDDFLNGQAKDVLLTTSAQMKDDGQMPHHYDQDHWTYLSIAQSLQTGPNIFWLLTAIKYGSTTGDYDFLYDNYGNMTKMLDYLNSFYDEEYQMLNVQGPLWIDVLVRDTYASDSNAIFPYVLRQMAELDEFVSNSSKPTNRSSFLRERASNITDGMLEYLVADSGDHFVTDFNPNRSPEYRDFVDYDSNLLAIAFSDGQFTSNFTQRIFDRVDGGNYTHVRATYCSEKKYNGESDCYIKGGDTCGDSVVTLGRIGWADAISRKVHGKASNFTNLILKPIQNDLLRETWLHERYDKYGNETRSAYYFEYPSLVTMLLREIKYGINIGLKYVEIDPFALEGASSFTYDIGGVFVSYSPQIVSLSIPFITDKLRLRITGLYPNRRYYIQDTDALNWKGVEVTTDSDGVLQTKDPVSLHEKSKISVALQASQ